MTLRTPSRVSQPAVSAALAVSVALAARALASAPALATLKGSVKLPGRGPFDPPLPGVLAARERQRPRRRTPAAPRLETVVVLENVNGAHPPPARTVTVEMGGLDAHPRLVISGPGSVLEIKNTGKVRLDMSTPDDAVGDAARAAAARAPPAA